MVVPTQNWSRCPPGELQKLASRLRFRHFAQTALTVAAAVLATAAVAGSVYTAVNVFSGPSYYATPECDPCQLKSGETAPPEMPATSSGAAKKR